jgi:hypothetical protein
MKENQMDDNITAAAMIAVNEMTAALDRFKAVIAKSRKNFESDLIAPMNEDQVGAYSDLKYHPERKQKQLVANPDLEPF